MKTIKQITESLESSPMFNLSLSSKELFHSNFIAWLITEYPNEMWKIFSKYTKLESEKYRINLSTIDREQKHIDIIFNVEEIGNESNFIEIIIENKVKSLPYLEQLKEYSDRFPNGCHILLSLSIPEHLITGEGKVYDGSKNWSLLTYADLAKELSKIDFNSLLSNL